THWKRNLTHFALHSRLGTASNSPGNGFKMSTHERRATDKPEPRFQRKQGGGSRLDLLDIGTTEIRQCRIQTTTNQSGSLASEAVRRSSAARKLINSGARS